MVHISRAKRNAKIRSMFSYEHTPLTRMGTIQCSIDKGSYDSLLVE